MTDLTPTTASKRLARFAGFLMGVTEVLNPEQAQECFDAIAARGGEIPDWVVEHRDFLVTGEQPTAPPPARPAHQHRLSGRELLALAQVLSHLGPIDQLPGNIAASVEILQPLAALPFAVSAGDEARSDDVVITVSEDDEYESRVLAPRDYLVVVREPAELTHVQAHPNGRVLLTIEGTIGPDVLVDLAAGVRTCRECGCTDDNACPMGCWWVPDPQGRDLCSTCAIKLGEPVGPGALT